MQQDTSLSILPKLRIPSEIHGILNQNLWKICVIFEKEWQMQTNIPCTFTKNGLTMVPFSSQRRECYAFGCTTSWSLQLNVPYPLGVLPLTMHSLVTLMILTLRTQGHWFTQQNYIYFLKFLKFYRLFYKLLNQYHWCLYSFECISHCDSKYGHEIPEFWHFWTFCAFFLSVFCPHLPRGKH